MLILLLSYIQYRLGLCSELWFEKRIQQTIESWGVLYIKLAQNMSTVRNDVIPQCFQNAIKRLQTDVSPERVDIDLGDELEISPSPLACGSIAQVYKGVYKGHDVAVKIVRSSVIPSLERFKRTRYVLRALEGMTGNKLLSIINHRIGVFVENIANQCDMMVEARNMEIASSTETYEVPRVYMEVCSTTVLVMEYMDGLQSLYDVLESKDGWCKRSLCDSLVGCFSSMLYDHKMFHGDMHPGNIYWRRGSVRPVLLDWGNVERVDAVQSESLQNMYVSIEMGKIEDFTRNWCRLYGLESSMGTSKVDGLIRVLNDSFEANEDPSMMSTLLLRYINANGLEANPVSNVVVYEIAFVQLAMLVKRLESEFNIAPSMISHIMASYRGKAEPPEEVYLDI